MLATGSPTPTSSTEWQSYDSRREIASIRKDEVRRCEGERERRSDLAERERQLDGDENGHRLAKAGAGLETPLLGGLDRFLVETER
jgi:hypothetical protein